ncbi:MAG: transcriptional regulator, partial [Chloroflexi bacterium]|nr:transcriptional regulator [Chloroflexota bacterium]
EVANEQVATITVRPTAYRVAVRGHGVLVRTGTTNKRLAIAQAEAIRPRPLGFEEEAVPGATLEDLDESIIEEYQRNHIRRGPRGESFSRLELLRDAGALDPSGTPTNSGMLLFGKYPHRFLPQVGVIVVRFKGTSVREAVATSERYLRRVEIVGPAARLVERTWEVLFEEIQQQPQIKGLKRQETFDYPVEAVREAVVNAICHRDYSITGQRIEIRLFDDRMEIISPGGLPGHMTLDNILEEHYSRNPRLVRGLFYWGYIEELGQGVDIMYEAMRREHHPAPEFRDTGRSFTVTLFNEVDEVAQLFGDQLNSRQARALRFLETNERITNRDYRELCPDVTPETLRLDLRDLVEKGILLKIGDKRGTCYVRK